MLAHLGRSSVGSSCHRRLCVSSVWFPICAKVDLWSSMICTSAIVADQLSDQGNGAMFIP